MSTSNTIIAFDLDDTLYNEYDYVEACLRNVAGKCATRFGVSGDQVYDDMTSAENPYDGLAAGVVGARLPFEEFLQIYRSTEPASLPMRADAVELLEWLKAERPDVKLFLITDGRRVGQRAKINAIGVRRFISDEHIIISAEIGGYGKQTPMPFAHAMIRANQPTGWIYIADNPAKDFYWANRLGWKTVMLRDTSGTNVHPQSALDTIEGDYRPQCIIDSLTEIKDLI